MSFYYTYGQSSEYIQKKRQIPCIKNRKNIYLYLDKAYQFYFIVLKRRLCNMKEYETITVVIVEFVENDILGSSYCPWEGEGV